MRRSAIVRSSSVLALTLAAIGGTAQAQTSAADPVAGPSTNAPEPAAPTPDARATSPDAVASGTSANGGEIVVTGTYAQSLKRARDKKRDSPLVIEALSVSDLKQLPDVSVADALSRLPGLAADRDPNNGAKSQISIRGMGPQLSLGTLNGRDLATATPDRNIRYDQFPSELIGGAVVYKSPMASINEGGVAGSIDLATIRPLDYQKNVFTADLRANYNQLGDQLAANKRFGVNGGVSFIGQFADHTIGIAIGYAGRRDPYNVIRTQHASYDPGGYQNLGGDSRSDNVTYQLSQSVRSGEDTRHGLVGVVEWKPSSVVHLTLDGLYSAVKLDGKLNGVVADRTNQEFANTYTNSVVNGNHLVAGTITANTTSTFGSELTVNDYAAISRRNDKLASFGGNLRFTPGHAFESNADVGYSRVHYVADYYELRAIPTVLTGRVLGTLPGQSVTFDARTEVPTFGNVNFNLTDPTINRPATLNLPFYQDGKDRITSLKMDNIFRPESPTLTAFRFGARYVDRKKSNLSLGQSVTLDLANRPILSGSQILPDALGSYNGAQRGAAPQFLNFDFMTIANQYFGGLHPAETFSSQFASWEVKERTLAGYGQFDYALGDKVTGNIGLRVVRTNDTSSSVRLILTSSSSTGIEPYTVKNNYTDVLPSFNLLYHAGGGLQFRAALAKTIARPALEDLNAGFQAYNFGTAQAYGGNPLLQPFRANQADLTAEYYFGKNDFVALTGFYKKLKSYITTSTSTVSLGGTDYQFFQPVNGHGGYIRGFEATIQKNFSGSLDGLGIYLNYAFVDSNVTVTRNFSDNTLGLVGLSKHTGTATVYYYKNGFDARLSYNYRSPYARVVDGGGFETNDGAGYLDAQLSYEFKKGASVVLQGSNLTNTPNKTYLGNDKDQRGRFEEFGRIFYAGFRFQL